jgi:phosphate-selective porin OprO and OprP
VRRASLALLVLLTASRASAQTPTVGFADGGFFIQADADNRLQIGTLVQTDGRFSTDNPLPIVNTFAIRKARPILAARLARYFDVRFMAEFGNGATTVLDAYFDVRFSPKFRLRWGKDKSPVGYELLQGDAFLLFPERSLPSSLVPNRDVGIQAQGDLGPKVFYAGGVFNGVPDGTSSTADVDVNSGKDVAGRMVLQPFRTAAASTGALNGFGFQVGGSMGKQTGALPVFRTSVGQSFFSYAAGSAADGGRTRVTPAVFYYGKSFGAFAEYARTSQTVTTGLVTSDIANEGWGITGSYVLTGEAASDRGVRPANPFDPQAGQWGAVQLVVRYSVLDIDDEVFAAGFGASGAADTARQFTVGVNWYPIPYVKYYATFERTAFEGGAGPSRSDEHVILFRAQLAF